MLVDSVRTYLMINAKGELLGYEAFATVIVDSKRNLSEASRLLT